MVRHLVFSALVLAAPLCLSAADKPDDAWKAKLAPAELDKSIKIPDGLTLELFAGPDQLKNPTAISLDPEGRVYVTETHRWRKQIHDNRNVPIRDFQERHGDWLMEDLACRTNDDRHNMLKRWANGGKFREIANFDHFSADTEIVRVLVDDNRDGAAEISTVFADTFNSPLSGTAGGIMVWDDDVFFANIPSIWRLRDADGDLKGDAASVIQKGFGVRTSISGHDLNGFAMGPDRRIYWSVGDRGYNFTTKEGKTFEGVGKGAVFRCELDGSNLERFCDGLRNPKEVVFDDFGNLFTVDNNADLGDRARVYFLMRGGDYGWRMGHQVAAGQTAWVFEEGTPYTLSAWMEEGIWERPFAGRPEYVVPPVGYITSGPCGFVANPGTVAFPGGYQDAFLIVDYRGAAARSGIHGFKLEPAGAGFDMKHARQILNGLALTDVEFGYDGKLYMSDYVGGWGMPDAGRILTLFDDNEVRSRDLRNLAKLARDDFASFTARKLAGLLDHADRRIRLRAQFALSDHADGFDYLRRAAENDNADLQERLHGVWGLGYLARRGDVNAVRTLEVLLADPVAQVRAQAVRSLGDAPLAFGSIPAIRPLVDDSDAYVASLALVALANHRDAAAFIRAVDLVTTHNPNDFSLRHAATYALQRCGTPDQLAGLADHPVPLVRQAAVVALRKLRSPQLAVFLGDSDRQIVREAARAIYDENVTAAFPQLAALAPTLILLNADHLGRYRGDPKISPDDREKRLERQLHRRVLYANFHVGKPENAVALMTYASDPAMPRLLRMEALHCVSTWAYPHALDRVIGDLRPVEWRRSEAVFAAVEPMLARLIEYAEGEILAKAVAMADTVGYEVPTPRLFQLLTNPTMDGGARANAIDTWLRRRPEDPELTLTALLADADDQVFLTALRALVSRRPDLATQVIQLVAYSPRASNYRRQDTVNAIRDLIPKNRDPLLETALNRLADGDLPGLIQLETAAVAEQVARNSATVADAFQKWQKAAAETQLGDYSVSLYGGWDQRGKEIFETHAAAQCTRCHSLYGNGGNAGPELGGIGKRASREYILESLINPGAVVASGWGIISATLTSGETLSGTLLKETDKDLVLAIGDEERTIPLDQIASKTDPVSAMPPMGALLNKTQLRHLVEFLARQTNDPPKPKDHQ